MWTNSLTKNVVSMSSVVTVLLLIVILIFVAAQTTAIKDAKSTVVQMQAAMAANQPEYVQTTTQIVLKDGTDSFTIPAPAGYVAYEFALTAANSIQFPGSEAVSLQMNVASTAAALESSNPDIFEYANYYGTFGGVQYNSKGLSIFAFGNTSSESGLAIPKGAYAVLPDTGSVPFVTGDNIYVNLIATTAPSDPVQNSLVAPTAPATFALHVLWYAKSYAY